ncbi:MAG: hypothetical protein R3C60_11770 [Parvularculaceae bacterium]
MTADGSGKTFGYDADNRLTSVSGSASAALSYDPAGRLYEFAGTATTRYLYDGGQAIGEYNASNTLLRRYVPGAGVDETLVWYDGSGTTNRHWLMTDPRGSVIAISDASAMSPANINMTNTARRPRPIRAASFSIPGKCGSPRPASITTRRASTTPNSAASCRPTRSAMATA